MSQYPTCKYGQCNENHECPQCRLDARIAELENKSLTPAEGHLVKHLIELYNAVWDEKTCQMNCKCSRCEALEEAGNHNVSTYDSLAEKAAAAMV